MPQPNKNFGCGGFQKMIQQKNFWLWRIFESQKMAVKNMKSYFGCGICPDPLGFRVTSNKGWGNFPLGLGLLPISVSVTTN